MGKELNVIPGFEEELSRHLMPVAAPEELWRRIQASSQANATVKPRKSALWALPAAITAVIALWCVSPRPDSTLDLAGVASRELASGSERFDLRSSDPLQIRAWVKAQAGINIPLEAGHSVEFIGVTLLHELRCAAVCVSYRVGNVTGKLLVARGGTRGPKHPSVQHTSYKGATVTSWVSGGQTYVIASPPVQDSHIACLLCHVDRPGAASLLL
jgi:hypothetical protein